MTTFCDYLVIGSGVAGLSFALKAAKHGKVILVTKRESRESNSYYAQGGVAAVMSEADSSRRHAQDTSRVGGGLVDKNVAAFTAKEGPARIRELMRLGVEFSREQHSRKFDLGKEGGHTRRRVLHAADSTGREMIRALLESVKTHPDIRILKNHIAIDLIMHHKIEGRGGDGQLDCLGAYVLDIPQGQVRTLAAPVTLLATGGCGKVYLYTSNPDVASGDGLAMAYRAGARIANMEFFQFHPTCLYHPKAKSFLISETLRGEGGELLRQDGTPFMKGYHESGSLAPRDVVARAIDTELKRTGDECVYLDMTAMKADFLQERFPLIHERCSRYGIDIAAQPIPVVPAAHYSCGGVVTDEHGRTNVEGLLVVGEAACTGLHGANRLASNSLLEGVVFAHRAAKIAAKLTARWKNGKPGVTIPKWDHGQAAPADENVLIAHAWDEIRRLMWNYVGIVRSNHRLDRALGRIRLIKSEIRSDYWKYRLTSDLIEVRNLALVAEMIITCAMMRKESRGLHWNVNYPYIDDERFKRNTVL